MRAKDPFVRRRTFNPATDTNFVEWPRPLPRFAVRILLTFGLTLVPAILLGLALPDRGIGHFYGQLALAAMITASIEQARWLVRFVARDISRYRSGEAT